VTELFQDLRFALRTLRKSPGFTLVALLSLALGIGANTAIFTLVDQLILRLLPVRNPQEIVLLAGRGQHYGGNNGRNALSYPMYQDFRDHNAVFNGMMARYYMTLSVGTGSITEVVASELVSGNYFPMLGVQPMMGRFFTASDDLHQNAHPLAVLSYEYWRTRFNANPAIIGSVIRVNNTPLTVIGVVRPGFEGMEPGIPTKLFVPLMMTPALRPGFDDMFNRRQRWVNVYGRLKPGFTIDRAKAGLQPLFHQIINDEVKMPAFRNATSYRRDKFLQMYIDVMPGSQGNTNLRRQYETPLLVLMGVVVLVLLIACANLASLLSARGASRQKEIAVRLALGSSRGRIVRQLITESIVLSVGGALAGAALAIVMVRGLLSFLPASIAGYSIQASPDARILAFTFGLAVITGILFGLAPALQSTRTDVAPVLKDQAGSVIGGGQTNRRRILVAVQFTLSLLLLAGAGLFVRSLSNLHLLDPGFDTANVVQFSVGPRSLGYTDATTAAFYRKLEERIRALPGVKGMGISNMTLLTGNEWDNTITIEGYTSKPGEDMGPHFNAVNGNFFDTLGIKLIAGRVFNERDERNAPKVAVVNQSFARRYFGNASPIGHRFGNGGDPGTVTDTEIIGVVADHRYESLRDEIPREVYLCELQREAYGNAIYVRTTARPENAFTAIRGAVRELDANLPIVNMKTMNQQLEDSLVTERLVATLSVVFGALATVLAIIGLYGVMSYTVARRSKEIGIRMAIGANSGDVVWLVMREVAMLAVAGVAVGLPAAIVLARVVRSQLYGVEPSDPMSIALATLLLCTVAMAAGYMPARRAAGYDPVRVLRTE